MKRWLTLLGIIWVGTAVWLGCTSTPAGYKVCQQDQDCQTLQMCVNGVCVGSARNNEATSSTETNKEATNTKESGLIKEPIDTPETTQETSSEKQVQEAKSESILEHASEPVEEATDASVPEFPQEYDPCSDPKNIKAEECNGFDDDCDGRVDNLKGEAAPLTTLCYDGLRETLRQGAPCQSGTTRCESGQWKKCQGQVLPKTEKCNGIDDDCNGRIDDNVSDAGSACKVKGLKGDCEPGRDFCENGKLTCKQIVIARTEKCDNKDDDCDGTIDGMTIDCYTGPSTAAGVGICKKGKQTCEAGVWSACKGEVLPKPEEICDEKSDDENCNGQSNETCKCVNKAEQDCGPSEGECVAGKQSCLGGKWGACIGAKGPTSEVCDGKDNDCDGTVDEGNPGGGTDCTIPGAQGACAKGKTICQKDKVVCEALVKAQPETCDGIDNNCNGKIDDGVLNTYYLDNDKDGYGDKNKTKQACKVPPGYTEKIGDCDDNNKDVHPGQTNYFSSPRSGGSFDYDCNGKNDKEYPSGGTCDKKCNMTRKGFSYFNPECGRDGPLLNSCYKGFWGGCGGRNKWTKQKCR